MKKIKKIAASIMAVASVVTSSVGMNCLSASAYQLTQHNATFSWGNGWAKMENNISTVRLAQVVVNVYNNTTGAFVEQKTDSDCLGLHEYVYASSTYSGSGYNWSLSGTIYKGNSAYSPVDWAPHDNLPHV